MDYEELINGSDIEDLSGDELSNALGLNDDTSSESEAEGVPGPSNKRANISTEKLPKWCRKNTLQTNFVLAGSSGLMLDFELYQGARTILPDVNVGGKPLGLGAKVVLRLCESLPKGVDLFVDRFFTSVELIDKLREKDISGT